MAADPTIAALRNMHRSQRIPHLKNALIEAVKTTLVRDVALFAIGVHEQTLCHRVAFHLETLWGEMGDMSIDCEYNRDVARYKEYDFEVSGRKKRFRPDIILHERLNGNYNMLAVESKPQDASKTEESKDKKKIERVIAQEPYRYDLGCYLHFLNGPNRQEAGVIVQFLIEGEEWSKPEHFAQEYSGEMAALSESRKK